MNYKDNHTYEKKNNFVYINYLINKYFKIRLSLENSATRLIGRGKNDRILGLHYRGTDKKIYKIENPHQLSDDDYIFIRNIINEGIFNRIFLATDCYYMPNRLIRDLGISIIIQPNIKSIFFFYSSIIK